jgi:hypothetical protein
MASAGFRVRAERTNARGRKRRSPRAATPPCLRHLARRRRSALCVHRPTATGRLSRCGPRRNTRCLDASCPINILLRATSPSVTNVTQCLKPAPSNKKKRKKNRNEPVHYQGRGPWVRGGHVGSPYQTSTKASCVPVQAVFVGHRWAAWSIGFRRRIPSSKSVMDRTGRHAVPRGRPSDNGAWLQRRSDIHEDGCCDGGSASARSSRG